jgi:hypothetical protein
VAIRARQLTAALWAGIVTNLLLAVPAVFAPSRVTVFFGLEPAVPVVWLRFSGWLLLLLSAFYVPAAIDPERHVVAARLAVLARFAGAIFFLGQIAFLILPRAYAPFGLADLFFGLVPGILLARLNRAPA